jgi:very-short-patch-repair endonuclease
MTKAEVLLWMQLKNKKLWVRILRQFSIGVFIVDFYCPALKLAIEVDGLTHHTDEEIEYDLYRENEISKLGIKFLRFSNIEIYEELHNVLEKIKREIEARRICKLWKKIIWTKNYNNPPLSPL